MQKDNSGDENLFNNSFFKKVNKSRENDKSTSYNSGSVISTTDVPLDGSDKSSIKEQIGNILDSAIKDMEKDTGNSGIGRIVVTRGGFGSGFDDICNEDSKVMFELSKFIREFFTEEMIKDFLEKRGYSFSMINDGIEDYETATKDGVDTRDYDLFEVFEYIELPSIVLKLLLNLGK